MQAWKSVLVSAVDGGWHRCRSLQWEPTIVCLHKAVNRSKDFGDDLNRVCLWYSITQFEAHGTRKRAFKENDDEKRLGQYHFIKCSHISQTELEAPTKAVSRACIRTSLFEVYTYLPDSGKIKKERLKDLKTREVAWTSSLQWPSSTALWGI